jgi:hypothetical protein
MQLLYYKKTEFIPPAHFFFGKFVAYYNFSFVRHASFTGLLQPQQAINLA